MKTSTYNSHDVFNFDCLKSKVERGNPRSFLYSLLTLFLLLVAKFGWGQTVLDNFNDDDYTSSPVWTVHTGSPNVTSSTLRINNSTVRMSTPFTTNANRWTIDLTSSSSSNTVLLRYYFILKDNADPSNAASDGYYMEYSSTAGDVTLYRLDNGVSTSIGTYDGTATLNGVATTITISRDGGNIFKLYVGATLRITTAAQTSYPSSTVEYQAITTASAVNYTWTVDNITYGGTYYNMSTANFSENFADMTNWTNNYVAGSGTINWRPAATATTGSTVNNSTVFTTSAGGGVQKGTQTLIILATGTNAAATDLLLNFTGRIAGSLSLDWAKVTNTVDVNPRSSDLKIQYSTDGGFNFTDLTGYTIPRINNNNTAESGTLNITLPTELNNQGNVVLRFFVWNNSQTGGAGNRPKWQLDNISVTSTAITAPAAPTISSITPGNQELIVAFTAGSDGGSAITNYKYSTDNGSSYTAVSPASTASPIVITGLTNGTTYNVKILAVNAVGDGTATASTAATPRTTPSAPTITSITPGNQQLSVAFTAGSDGGSAITNYKYSTDNGSNYTAVSPAATTSPIVITGLTNGTTYDVKILAVNVAGDGAASSTTSATPVAPVSPTLNAVTLSSSLTSTYGTASTGVSFTASGSNLTGNITATAQSGYEVSTSLGSGYDVSVSVASGTTVYVRFASTRAAGTFNSATAVVLSGGGASSDANVTTSSSGNTVSQKALTVTGLTAQNKVYDGLTTATATGTAALSGVVSPDAVSLSGTPTFTFDNSTVGTSKTVNTTNYSLTGAQAGNYTLTQPTLAANITVRSLTITANNVSKVQGVLLTGGAGSTAFTSSGLQNGETIGSVTITYGSAGATTGDGNTVGVYASQVTPSVATGGTFIASNYSISYVVGSITVLEVPITIAAWDFTTDNNPNIDLPGGSASLSFNTGGTTGTSGCTGNGYSISGWNVNEYLQIVIPSTGYELTGLVFNVRSSGTGPGNFKIQYSSTGSSGSFNDLSSGTFSSGNNVCVARGTFDLSSINVIDNNSNSVIRLVFTGGEADGSPATGDANSAGTFRIDDIVITGYVLPTAPLLTLPTATSIATTSATLGATISSDGGATITSRGTVYGTSASPTSNSEAEGGTSVAAFSHSRTSLTANTFYYYRGYAINSVGTGYSADGTFTTLHNAPTVGSGSNATTTTIDASWTAPTGGSATFTYEIEVDDNSDFSSPSYTQSSISSATTTITATGLTSNTTYFFRVRANNAGGNSAWSSSSAGYATLEAVNPTLSTTALAAFGNICLNVTSAANSITINGSALTSADVSVSSLPGFTFSTTIGGTYTSTLTLPQVGGTYSQTIYVKFTPTAVQSYDGNIVVSGGGASTSENVAASGSGISGTVNVTTTAASAISTTGASSGGSSLSTSCGTITSKGVAYGTTANPTTPVTSDGSGSADYSSTLTGLTPNTEYNYRAYATNSNGVTSYGSNLTFTTLHNAPTVGTGTLANTTGFTANWTAPTSGGSATFTYEVAVSTSPTFASTLSTQSGISSASTSYQFTGLSNGTTYYFRVLANNAGGSSEWSAISASISTQTVFENFETGSKGSYTSGDVNCTSGSWNFNNALIGTSASDRKYGSQSARIQSTGVLSMNFDVTNGISSLTVYHARYGTDPNVTWKLEVSNNSGSSWDAYVSSDVTTSSTTLTAQSFNIDLCGTLRFRIVKLTGTRLNIDDIVLVEKAPTPSAPTASSQSFCSSSYPTVADLTVTSGSSIKWYDASTNGNLLAIETALTTGNYYASQTVLGCESSSRTTVSVTLNSNGTWIGGSTGAWNLAGNWCGGVPNSNSAVVSVPTGITINLDTSPDVSELTIASTSVINAGSNTITIANGGTFTNNGTFNAQTGTVAFSGTGTLAGNVTTFNNLTTNGNLTIGTSPTINGTLTLSSGTLTVGANTLTLNGSISRTSGNIDASNASASVIFGGSSEQTIPASTFTENINNLTLNNSAGLTTNQALTVANTLRLSSGVLTLGSNDLTLNGSLHGTDNGSSTAYINTNSTGAFIRSISTTGFDYNFPVGLSSYAPITVNFIGGTLSSSTLASRVVSGRHPNAAAGAYIHTNLYWEMNQTGMTNPQYNVSFTYPGVTNGPESIETEANLLPAKWSASTGWLSSGSCAVCFAGTKLGTSSLNTDTKTITWDGVSGFSDFGGFGSGSGSPLPVELLSFNSSCEEDYNVLTWKTASEHNSAYFDIEKSRDGEFWNVIGQQAAAGNSTELLSYQFVDAAKSISTVYYRLNQVDIDGKNKIYGPIKADCELEENLFYTFPNPSGQGGFSVLLNAKELIGHGNLNISDANGTSVYQKSVEIEKGVSLWNINEPNLAPGVYFIKVANDNNESKIIKHIQN
jgi:predicted RNA-binding protein with TRAM domain